MRNPIYLDYAATTPVAPEVAAKMGQCLTLDGVFANPASRAHLFGWQAEEAVEIGRGQVAELIQADPREIVFTSGATESNNLALKGVAFSRADRGRHIITSQIEHKAVLDTCAWLANQGFEVTYLAPEADGRVSAESLHQALRDDTILVSLMHVNNELGTVNDIASLGALCRERDIAFHTDAAQSAGKVAIDVSALAVDLMSVSAHKMYGPKGIGALYVRRSGSIVVQPQMHGGGHERGMRSGTLPTHQIAGFGVAAQLAAASIDADHQYLAGLALQFWRGIQALPGIKVNGVALEPLAMTEGSRIPGIVNVNFGPLDGEQLLFALQGVAVSTGSACTSASVEPSYVLKGIGVSDIDAHGSLRFSFGRFTTVEDVEQAVLAVTSAVKSLATSGQSMHRSTL